jgi:penicillin-binding protein 1C
MKFVYPPDRALVVLPRDASGEKLPLIAQLTHRNPTIEVFWHLDNEFIGTTKTIHQMAVLPTIGEHILTAVDASGNRLSVTFGVTK